MRSDAGAPHWPMGCLPGLDRPFLGAWLRDCLAARLLICKVCIAERQLCAVGCASLHTL